MLVSIVMVSIMGGIGKLKVNVDYVSLLWLCSCKLFVVLYIVIRIDSNNIM